MNDYIGLARNFTIPRVRALRVTIAPPNFQASVEIPRKVFDLAGVVLGINADDDG